METVERSFNVTGPGRLSVANISGSVDIQPGEDGIILVNAAKHANGDVEHTQIEIEQAPDGSVTVKTDYQESVWRLFGQRPCDVDYVVRVPRRCTVQLRCVSSNGTVRGLPGEGALSGEFNLSTISGKLTVADLSGPLKLNAVSGDINGERLAGPLKVESVSGDVELRACQLGPMDVSTVSGNIALETETPLANSPHRFHSVSGEVRLVVPAQTRCTVEGTSLSGHVQADLPVTRSEHQGPRWHIELQGGSPAGGPEIRFDSISGNMAIERGRSASEAPAGATAPSFAADTADNKDLATDAQEKSSIAAAEQTRRDILDRIARGEMSVDEAVKVLRG